MTGARVLAAILADLPAADRLFRALEPAGVGLADVWVASRSEATSAAFETRGVEVLTTAIRHQGLMAGLARVAALVEDDRGVSLREELESRGVDAERAAHLERALVEPAVLVGMDGAFATSEVVRCFVEAGADFGLANGPGLVRVVPLRRETLDVVKRVVVDAEVTVRTEIVTETKRVEVALEREEIVIETRDPADPAAAPRVVRIPVRHEEAIFDKRVVVTAEVSVRTEHHVDARTVTESLRHEVLRIDDPAGVAGAPASLSEPIPSTTATDRK